MPEEEKTPIYALRGSGLKGGELRGGSKRWIGKGPKPARHIPWPELFKHHLSVVEGHLKMIDMVCKHTVEGTGDYRTFSIMLDRCHQMLYDTMQASRDFVIPWSNFDEVPLGSSSASRYPGCPPVNHESVHATQLYGNVVTKAAKPGATSKSGSNRSEYQLGQSKGAGYRAFKATRQPFSNEKASGGIKLANGNPNGAPLEPRADPKAPITAEVNKYFVVNKFRLMTNKHTQEEEKPEEKPSKKVKKFHKDSEDVAVTPIVEHEDISEVVDQRMKEKEEKRKARKEKKRKRESADESVTFPKTEGFGENSVNKEAEATEKPSKKKSKKHNPVDEVEAIEIKSQETVRRG